MKKILFFLLLILGLIIITMSFIVLKFAWDTMAKYGFSSQNMGNETFGFIIGFAIIGIIFLIIGLVISLIGYKKFIRRLRRDAYRRMRGAA